MVNLVGAESVSQRQASELGTSDPVAHIMTLIEAERSKSTGKQQILVTAPKGLIPKGKEDEVMQKVLESCLGLGLVDTRVYPHDSYGPRVLIH